MPRESKRAKKARAEIVLEGLERLYPAAATELDYRTPFELLIATILSAQATDVSVNAATPALFTAYPDAHALARAEPDEVEPLIRTIGLFRSKARNIVGAARHLVEHHRGELPNDMAAMLKLPGVGRKTANVVLSNVFGRPAIAVDTHVGRLARRLGFSAHADPNRVEKDLEEAQRWYKMAGFDS